MIILPIENAVNDDSCNFRLILDTGRLESFDVGSTTTLIGN